MKNNQLKTLQNEQLQLVVFDGVCNFCNSWVEFLIKRDPKKRFNFAPLQSDLGKEIKAKYYISEKDCDSILYIKGKKLFVKSTAALNILKDLGGFWTLFYAFIIIPKGIRNYFYDVIAKNRYKWFGKKDQCMIPSEDTRNRFLDF